MTGAWAVVRHDDIADGDVEVEVYHDREMAIARKTELGTVRRDGGVKPAAQVKRASTRGVDDHYADRVRDFHDEVRGTGDEDYLTVLADRLGREDLPLMPDARIESEEAMSEILAERNRLFWSSFLAEETGEVASCLTSGEPPEDFEDEVADVLVLCHAIADCFEFSMRGAFDRVMTDNESKPKTQEGTGKLPSDARDEWRGRGDDE